MDPLTEIWSPALGLIPAALAALLVWDWRRHAPDVRLRRIVLPLAMLAAWSVLPSLWLVATTLPGIAGASAILLAAGLIALRRDDLRKKLRGTTPARHVAYESGLLAMILVCGFYAIEQPYNPGPVTVLAPFVIADLALMALMLLASYFVGQRRPAAPAALTAILGAAGIAQYYLWQFKNAAILPTDLFALGTAAAVAGGYSYTLRDPALFGLSLCVLGIVLCGFLGPERAERPCRRSVAANVGAGALACVALACAVTIPNYTELGARINYFWPLYTYRQHGSILSFVAGAQDLVLRTPADYSDQKATDDLAEYVRRYDDELASDPDRTAAEEQFADEQPSIVVVMNETFSDLSIYGELRCGYTGPSFFKTGLTDGLSHGALSVSVNGGGTCNSEFEFLTGNSMAFLGLGKYPYAIYDFEDCDALPKQLAQYGYTSTAIHPNWPTNWNRETVYEWMGFDSFLSIYDFEDSETFHNGVTDRATYDRILRILEDDDSPQFVFDVTMQNHSDYNVGNIPADRLTDYQPEGFSSQTNSLLNEYLSCIQASDEDLEYFVGRLRELDRPVILVFFGDHQPNFAADYNDAWYADEDDLTHNQRLYQTVYSIWANYDVAGDDQSDTEDYTSPAYLAAQTLSAIGAPLTDYQKAELAMREEMPAMNAFGYLGANGTWYETDDDGVPMSTLASKLDDITYWRFARKLR